MTATEASYETVHIVEDWYDGPRNGYADYEQQPHFYRSLHLDGDNYEHYNYDEDRFEMTPVSAQVLEWAIASHQLWVKWDEAHRTGTLPEGADVRILPEDRVHYQKLCDRIKQHLDVCPEASFIVRGKFELGCRRVQWYERNA